MSANWGSRRSSGARVSFILRLLTVFGLGAVELWAAFPAGLAFGLSPPVVGVVTAAGALTGVAVIVYPGERLRSWLVRRYSRPGKSKSMNRATRLWERYGVIGVGLIAPLVVGVPLAAALGIALGAPRQRLVLLLALVVLAWCVVLTIASYLGLAGLHALRG
jgi:undecaprenyl pyrophosphate phosphatase UppP